MKRVGQMKKKCMYIIGLLFFWFTLDMTGAKIGEIILVEAAWNTIDGVWWLIFLALSLLFFYKDKVGRYLLLGIKSKEPTLFSNG